MREITSASEKAERFLATAECAFRMGDYDSGVSRSYYFDCISPAKPPQPVGGKNRLKPTRLW